MPGWYGSIVSFGGEEVKGAFDRTPHPCYSIGSICRNLPDEFFPAQAPAARMPGPDGKRPNLVQSLEPGVGETGASPVLSRNCEGKFNRFVKRLSQARSPTLAVLFHNPRGWGVGKRIPYAYPPLREGGCISTPASLRLEAVFTVEDAEACPFTAFRAGSERSRPGRWSRGDTEKR
jgi:hypothetical protein